MKQPGTTRIAWRPAYRIVSSRFPPIPLFERVADPDDLDAVYAIESMTNPRLRDQVGELALVPRERRVSGEGTSPIMAAFTHLNPEGSRFSPGTYGVFYAAKRRRTAIEETAFHRERFLARTREAPCRLEMRCYAVDLRGRLHDIRGGWPALHDPDSYAASQRFGAALRSDGSDGLVYDSVRDPGHACAAVFHPDLLASCRQQAHLYYHWNGERIARVVVAGEVVER